jgi:hypothetical protein
VARRRRKSQGEIHDCFLERHKAVYGHEVSFLFIHCLTHWSYADLWYVVSREQNCTWPDQPSSADTIWNCTTPFVSEISTSHMMVSCLNRVGGIKAFGLFSRIRYEVELLRASWWFS